MCLDRPTSKKLFNVPQSFSSTFWFLCISTILYITVHAALAACAVVLTCLAYRLAIWDMKNTSASKTGA